jgi:hypothetical protein
MSVKLLKKISSKNNNIQKDATVTHGKMLKSRIFKIQSKEGKTEISFMLLRLYYSSSQLPWFTVKLPVVAVGRNMNGTVLRGTELF